MDGVKGETMAQIKVIYKNQSSGTIEDSFLGSLIEKGEIVAYCSSTEWLGVKNELTCGIKEDQSNVQNGRNIHQSAGNYGNFKTDMLE